MIQPQIKLIHRFMLAGLIIASLVFYYITQDKNLEFSNVDINIQYFGIVFGIINLSMAYYVPRILVKDFKPLINKKISYQVKYQTIKIIQFAFMEGAALLNFVLYYLAGNLLNFYMGIGTILVFTTFIPSDKDFLKLFSITESDLEETKNIDFD